MPPIFRGSRHELRPVLPARRPAIDLTLEGFNAYFSDRPNFELKATQAWYSNEETGVYFSFDYGEPESDDAWLPRLPVSLNVNYFRPHTFGLEAQLELALFVKRFELTVVDPQKSGMGEGEYSQEGFLRGWNAGNEVAYEALVERNPTATYPSLPAAKLEAVWLWNYSVPTRQRNVGDNVFVPRIFFVALPQGPPLTAAVWGDGIPVLLPDVDFYFLPRKRFAPKPLPSSAKPELTQSTRAELAPMLSAFKEIIRRTDVVST